MTSPTGADLCYALAARKKARYLSRLYDSHLAAVSLSISQFSILSLLQNHGPLKLAELADKLVMERTSLVRALKPLQAAGWVSTAPAESGRSLVAILSSTGAMKIEEAVPLWEQAQAGFEEEIGRDRAVRQRNDVLKLKLGP